MKYFTIIFALIFCNVTSAQEKTSIKVTARVVYTDKTPLFKASVTLSASYSSFPPEAISLKQMKAQYNEALQEHGLSLTDLTENAFAYTILGYEKEGTVYEYTTPSLKNFENFLATKSFGVQRLSYGGLSKINFENAKQLSKQALENAKAKATSIAQSMGRQLDGIISIEDNNLINTEFFRSVNYDRPATEYWYEIKVAYALK